MVMVILNVLIMLFIIVATIKEMAVIEKYPRRSLIWSGGKVDAIGCFPIVLVRRGGSNPSSRAK